MNIKQQKHVKILRNERYRIAREYCSYSESQRIKDFTTSHFILYMYNKIHRRN